MSEDQIKTVQANIFAELSTLPQFIVINENRILNILNGSEIFFNDDDCLWLRWEMLQLDLKEAKSKPRSHKLELHNSSKYLKTMKAQAKGLI